MSPTEHSLPEPLPQRRNPGQSQIFPFSSRKFPQKSPRAHVGFVGWEAGMYLHDNHPGLRPVSSPGNKDTGGQRECLLGSLGFLGGSLLGCGYTRTFVDGGLQWDGRRGRKEWRRGLRSCQNPGQLSEETLLPPQKELSTKAMQEVMGRSQKERLPEGLV